jgi:uncharacterized protein (TIGR02145 family)
MQRIKIWLFTISIITLLSLCRCSESNETYPPVIETNKVIKKAGNSIIFEGVIKDNGGSKISKRGFFWSNHDPNSSLNFVQVSNETDVFTYEFQTEAPNLIFYVRAYAENEVGNTYGNVEVFHSTKMTFLDTSTGITYKITKIGEQTWMAENLANSTMYSWDMAMKACPSGWHLATHDEWKILENFINQEKGPFTYFHPAGFWENLGIHLKTTYGWYSSLYTYTNGTDYYGFSAIQTGYRPLPDAFANPEEASWWTATQINNGGSYKRVINNWSRLIIGIYSSSNRDCIRCIKNK